VLAVGKLGNPGRPLKMPPPEICTSSSFGPPDLFQSNPGCAQELLDSLAAAHHQSEALTTGQKNVAPTSEFIMAGSLFPLIEYWAATNI
jgi:hypothetical protein